MQMDQDKIAKFIKRLREENKLTQKDLADKYNISAQAVSKWEKGINIPDIVLLKQISKDFNVSLDNILDGNYQKSKKRKVLWIIPIIVIIVIVAIIISRQKNDFEFKTISSNCSNFSITGSIAYNESKSSIYISNIDYCGEELKESYNNIECTLYESGDKVNTKISTYNYNNKEAISLSEFLNNVSFNVENYNKTCKNYNESSLFLQVDATDINNNITSYKIPLSLDDNCAN